MNVAENDRYAKYTATSGQTVFVYDWPVYSAENVLVLQNGSELTYGVDYTVSGEGSESGGNVTLTSGATLDDVIVIYSGTPEARTTQYTGTSVDVTAANTSDNTLTFQTQQLRRDVNRSLRNSLSDGDIDELPSVSDRSDSLASWDSSGNLSYEDPATGVLSEYLRKDQNLSDVASAATARTNLGLGDSATKDVGAIAGTVASGTDSRFLTTAQKGGLTSGSSTDASSLHTHSNLISSSEKGVSSGVATLNSSGKLTSTQVPSNIVTTAATGSTDNEIVVFNSTSGANIKNSSKSLPSGEVVGTTDSQTITNKTIDLDSNTLSNIEVDNLKSGVLDTDLSSVAATDTTIPSAKATKTYADTKAGSLSNIGTGTGTIGTDIISGDLKLKTILAGPGIVINNNSDDIRLSADTSAITPGFVNVGSGEGEIYKETITPDVYLRTLKQGSGITISTGTDEITIDADTETYSGFNDLTESSVSFDSGTRTYSISPTATSFGWRDIDENAYVSTGDSVVITDISGLHFIYYDGSTLSSKTGFSRSQLAQDLIDYVGVGFVQWNATDGVCVSNTDYRYTQNVSNASRVNQGFNHQINPYSGCALGDDPSSGGTVLPTGNNDTDAQFSMGTGELLFCDRRFITAARSVGDNWKVAYMSGSHSSAQTKTSFSILQDTDFSTTSTGRIVYNNSGTPTVVTSGRYVWYFVGVTNSTVEDDRYISIMGQHEYSNQNLADSGFSDEVLSVRTQFDIKQELKLHYGVLFQTADAYSNSVKARIIDTRLIAADIGSISGTTIPSELIDGSDASSLHNHESLYLEKADNLSDLTDASTARTNLGVEIGTDVQAYDATLQSLSSLGTASDKYAYTTGIDTWAEGDITAAGRAILDDADASAQRTTLGLGTIATQASDNVSITGGSITGITDIAIADGGTGASTATDAFDNLSPTTTKGDLISNNGSNNIRLGVGSDNDALISDSSEASGIKWGRPAAEIALVYLDTSQSISSGVTTVVICDTETSDVNNWYNTTNGRFTPTIAGKYLVSLISRFESNTSAGIGVSVRKNSTEVRYKEEYSSSIITPIQIEAIVDMNGSTDYIDITLLHAVGSSINITGGGRTTVQFVYLGS